MKLFRINRCPHTNIRGIYGDEINVTGGWRLQCANCYRFLAGPVTLATDPAPGPPDSGDSAPLAPPVNRREIRKNGVLHCVDGPAVFHADGRVEWYLNGKLHRDRGPAIIFPDDEFLAWYQHGELHRTNGPAAVHDDGTEFWYQNGRLHRVDGPAATWADGRSEWWIDGVHRSTECWISRHLPPPGRPCL